MQPGAGAVAPHRRRDARPAIERDAARAPNTTDLRTVRSGGHPWGAAELLRELTAAGLAEVHAVPRTWSAPVQLFAGRTPA